MQNENVEWKQLNAVAWCVNLLYMQLCTAEENIDSLIVFSHMLANASLITKIK